MADPASDLAALLEIMRRLRDSKNGCPWDREQTFETIAPYTIEEAYEVAGAIEEQDWPALKQELGDLLFQVIYHAQLAGERGLFDFADVVQAVTTKMIARHPHVFGGGEAVESAAAQTVAWEAHKTREREQNSLLGLLDDVPRALPALMRAEKLQKRASTVGFDWDSANRVIEKLTEEASEIASARDAGAPNEKIAEEVGDLLFVVANLARHLNVDPESALRGTNAKFVRRFKAIEAALAVQGRELRNASLEEMEALWQAAKEAEA